MRFFIFSLAFLMALSSFAANDGLAQEPEALSASDITEFHQELDQLYVSLRKANSDIKARSTLRQIQKEINAPGGTTADLLIDWAMTAMREGKFAPALDLLNNAITLYPNYTDAFTRRALLHIAMSHPRLALGDIASALEIEPRHLDALHALAGILRTAGMNKQALDVYRRILELYPRNRTAQSAYMSLVDSETEPTL